MNTSEACRVLKIKIISSLIPIWCGVKGKLANKNSKGFTLLFNIEYEGSIGSAYSLTNFSLPLTSSLIIMAT
jgi:hypothetical protein